MNPPSFTWIHDKRAAYDVQWARTADFAAAEWGSKPFDGPVAVTGL